MTAMTWIRPAAWNGSATSLAEHVEAIGAVMRGNGRLWLGPFAPPADLPVGFEDTALVVPTSGSTGVPKAVALTRDALLASQDATATALDGHGFWLPLLPPTHIAGIQVIARAHRTAQLHGLDSPALPDPLPDLTAHFDSAAFITAAEPALAQASAAGLPAFTSLVPTQLIRIVTGATGPDARARAVLRRFDAVLVGGAAIPADVLARARAARIQVRTTYGSSETAGGCVYDRRPLDGVTLRIDGPADGGRLVIAAPSLALGYLTADGPTTDGFDVGPDGRREFRTSDIATIDDGLLTVIGRADDVVNTGGKKVVPQDVERAIERSLMLRDMVRDCVIVGVPDPEWGQRLEALVTLSPWISPAEATPLVRAALQTSEAPSHWIPRRAHVVDEIPLLGIGKVDRAAARRIAIERAATDPALAPHDVFDKD